MSIQLSLPLAPLDASSMLPGNFRRCTTAATEIALELNARLDGLTMDELRAECIARGVKPSINNWWGTVLRQRFVQTHESRDHAALWRLA